MTEADSLLAIEQEIIEADAAVSEKLFSRRISRLLLFVMTPAIGGAIAAGNVFGDFSKPGHGRAFMNFALGALFLVSLIGSLSIWSDSRSELRSAQVNLRKALAKKSNLQYSSHLDGQSISNAFRNYLDSVPGLRDDYRRGAQKYRNRHNRFQITVIVGSILTSVATTAAAEQGIWSWIAVGLSAIVSIAAGIISYFKFRERSMNLQQTADSIELELQAFSLRINHYSPGRVSTEEAPSAFAETIERIKDEQRKKELQLEQPPEVQQGNTASRGAPAQ
ncbi:DUF4231 domain-containing protein [Streptomyces deccanensis]|uniref:DUF4231 domain-containing protein n=1 Tax=Streptomyces deccanensis TaxID=424188 RepID=UPI001EFB9FAD|nr:DUF4231 domain-containing protein [Streptomyces deccanensis]ULR52256.1 DUF4231 domain-containing protein [Streptomyces deccanensis]